LVAHQAAAYAKSMAPMLTTRPTSAVSISEPTTKAAPAPLPVTQPTEPELMPNQPLVVDGPLPFDPVPPTTRPAQLAVRPTNDPQYKDINTTDELLNRLRQRARDFPNDVAGQFDFQLIQFLREEKVPQMPEMSALPTEDREILAALLDSLTNFRNGLRRDNNMLMSNKIQPLIELATRLRSKAELTIPTIALCKAVRGFGVYDPVPAEFAAGKEQPLIVYCEVENFASQLNAGQQWETKLKQEVELYTETGLSVWKSKSKIMTDVSRNRRHDFFLVEMIHLPSNLTIGRYLLKASVVDQNVNRIAEATLPIKIVAGMGAAETMPAK
jgi:hypothetical protein